MSTSSRDEVPHISTADIQRLAMPGQAGAWPAFPKELWNTAPWLIIVYLAFRAGWSPVQIEVLVVVLTPIALFGRFTGRA